MGKAYMRVSYDMLQKFLGLPDDVEIVDCTHSCIDVMHASLTLLLHSPRLPDPVPGEELTEVLATFHGIIEDPRFDKFRIVADEHQG